MISGSRPPHAVLCAGLLALLHSPLRLLLPRLWCQRLPVVKQAQQPRRRVLACCSSGSGKDVCMPAVSSSVMPAVSSGCCKAPRRALHCCRCNAHASAAVMRGPCLWAPLWASLPGHPCLGAMHALQRPAPQGAALLQQWCANDAFQLSAAAARHQRNPSLLLQQQPMLCNCIGRDSCCLGGVHCSAPAAQQTPSACHDLTSTPSSQITLNPLPLALGAPGRHPFCFGCSCSWFVEGCGCGDDESPAGAGASASAACPWANACCLGVCLVDVSKCIICARLCHSLQAGERVAVQSEFKVSSGRYEGKRRTSRYEMYEYTCLLAMP